MACASVGGDATDELDFEHRGQLPTSRMDVLVELPIVSVRQ
jgi:hypothetical protein